MVESSDFVFREALREVTAFESPSARALVVYLTVQSALHGQFEFYQDKLLTNLILERIYSELRERQAEQLQESNQKKALAAEERIESNEDTEGVDGDFDEDEFADEGEEKEEEPVQMLGFQDQLAADLDLIEAGVVRRDSSSGAFHLQVDQLRATSAVISDATARFQYTPPELINYAFDVMGIRD
jgi:hypothetical protein